MKTGRVVFFAALLVSGAITAQARPAQSASASKKSAQDAKAQQWIAKLKDTPLLDMEAGMPDKTFGTWFAAMVRPGVPHYVVKECGAPSADQKSKGPMCVVASAKVSRVRRLELTFAVIEGVRTAQSDKNPQAAPHTSWRFLVGLVGSSDPHARVATRVITRLSELPPLSRRPAPCSFCRT